MFCLSTDLPEDFDWAAYLMEGISLVSYSESDDEVKYMFSQSKSVLVFNVNVILECLTRNCIRSKRYIRIF